MFIAGKDVISRLDIRRDLFYLAVVRWAYLNKPTFDSVL